MWVRGGSAELMSQRIGMRSTNPYMSCSKPPGPSARDLHGPGSFPMGPWNLDPLGKEINHSSPCPSVTVGKGLYLPICNTGTKG